jgi:hypothetical protein
MPRARNTTVGPKADALDAAAKARDRAERTAELTRLEVLNKLVEAIDAGMPIAEAARRAGYTREHVSKLYATAKGTRPAATPRKRTARELMTGKPDGPALRRMRGHDGPA